VRVLYVLDHDSTTGGVVQAVEMIVRYGTSRGLQAAVITPHGDSPSAIAMRKAGAAVFPFGQPFTFSKCHPLASLHSVFRFSKRLRSAIEEFKPNVLETNHATAESYTSFGQHLIHSSLPRVFCQRGNLGVYRGVSHVALRLALRSVTTVISVSPFSDREYARVLGISPEKLLFISDCTEMHRMDGTSSGNAASEAIRKSWQHTPDDVLVGIVGYVTPNKNQALLVEAAREICRRRGGVRFLIVGTPETDTAQLSRGYMDDLIARVNDYGLGDHVVFTGFVDKREAIPALDILVSLSNYEGFGMSVIEAAACGKPVVATRSGGPDHIVQDGRNGFLIPRDDVQMLVERLTTLIDDGDLRATMGRQGREVVLEHYDPVDKVDARIALYERLVSGH
jgi:glycosyltransferase involved in cell wall biosynthesis